MRPDMVARSVVCACIAWCLLVPASAETMEVAEPGTWLPPTGTEVLENASSPSLPDAWSPTALVVHPVEEGARLLWQPPPAGTPTGYLIYRSTDGEAAAAIASTSSTSYVDASALSSEVHVHVYHVVARYDGAPEAPDVPESLSDVAAQILDLLPTRQATLHGPNGSSNPGVYLSGPWTDCMLVRVVPQTQPTVWVHVGYNPDPIGCIMSQLPP